MTCDLGNGFIAYGASDGTPFQEMAEKADKRIAELEDICEKGLDLVTALIQRHAETANDVYQAQLDAQDWQNKFNNIARYRDWKRGELVNRIQELTDQNTELELKLEQQTVVQIPNSLIMELQDLRARNERQRNIIIDGIAVLRGIPVEDTDD